jgi:urease subunit gamma/beta
MVQILDTGAPTAELRATQPHLERGVLAGVTPGHVVGEHGRTAVFDDGTRMVVVRHPFGEGAQGLGDDGPGAVLTAEHVAEAPAGLVYVPVVNTSDVPVSITSHFHFFEVNPRLRFDRSAGYGMRLAIPAGSSLRFDPGVEVQAPLVPIGGARIAIGFAGLVDGPLDEPGTKEAALARAAEQGYLGATS